jgi:hypothetical protein
MRSAGWYLLAARRRFASVTLHHFKCSQLPHPEYKIVLKEIYDDWCLKKQSDVIFVAFHAILRRIRRSSVLRHLCHPSRYFAAHSSPVTLIHARQICVIWQIS